jgi:tetratricopeptide (TPR) repeat protein
MRINVNKGLRDIIFNQALLLIVFMGMLLFFGCETTPEVMNVTEFNKRGVAYANKGEYDKAISDFKKALEIDPTYSKASYNLRLAYIKVRHEQAISELNEQIDGLKKENQRIRDENENRIAMIRDQNPSLNQQIDNLRQENQRTRDENKVLAEKLTKLQLKHETFLSKSYKMYVHKRSVRVRKGPGIEYKIVGGRKFGDKLFTTELKGVWYRIVDPKDFHKTIGWIHRALLGKMPPGQ